jgi:hypothetical protein
MYLPYVGYAQLLREAQLGGYHPVGVVVVGDEHFGPHLFGIGLQPLPESPPVARK